MKLIIKLKCPKCTTECNMYPIQIKVKKKKTLLRYYILPDTLPLETLLIDDGPRKRKDMGRGGRGGRGGSGGARGNPR